MKSYYDLKHRSPALDALLKRVELTIHSVVPSAAIVLYGSRARGDATPVSDWDFLILVDQPLDQSVVATIRDRLYDLELETNTILTSIIRNRDEWNSPRYSVLPFKRVVEQEGVLL